ncbi:MAG TPA: GNAT family N-acetyltransferase [Clostridiales bacterium]|jgi:ribosomal-protein-alanine N-acetyltransferase|nr:GNAT family N-acetyltransferase [Clostridiales bacterium]
MLNHTGTEELSAPGLLLRRFTLEDAPAMFANWASDERVTRYLSWSAHASVEETKEILAQWIPEYEKSNYYHWLIVLEGIPVGSMSLFDVSDWHRHAEVGYCIGAAYWNRGITTKALALVMDFAFGTVGFERLIAKHDVENPASGRVMQKVGMAQEGILRRHCRRKSDGIYSDLVCYGILKEEWAARRKTPALG